MFRPSSVAREQGGNQKAPESLAAIIDPSHHYLIGRKWATSDPSIIREHGLTPNIGGLVIASIAKAELIEWAETEKKPPLEVLHRTLSFIRKPHDFAKVSEGQRRTLRCVRFFGDSTCLTLQPPAAGNRNLLGEAAHIERELLDATACSVKPVMHSQLTVVFAKDNNIPTLEPSRRDQICSNIEASVRNRPLVFGKVRLLNK